MKLNNKGFTLVELLATISLIAILSGVAISAVSRYQEKSRKETYKAMESSAFTAAQNYIQETGIVIPSDGTEKVISISELVDKGYLEPLQDPSDNSKNCHTGSEVRITKEKGSNGKLDKYTYLVIIKCKNYESSRPGYNEEYYGDGEFNNGEFNETLKGVYYYS